ncbi:MAG: hypothetical protein ABFQ53_02485 [Patescibacteria group bacterium]
MKKKKGTAIVYGLVMIVVASVIFVGLLRYVTAHLKLSTHAQPRQQALHIAESGIYFYRWYLGHNVDGKTMDELFDFWNETSPAPHGIVSANVVDDDECNETDGGYIADYDGTNGLGKYSICVTKPGLGTTAAEILSTGWTYKEPDVKRSVRVRMRRPPWSEFVLLSDSNLSITQQTTFFGAVHSNGGIEFNGTANGAVSSSVLTYDHDDNVSTAEVDGVWSQTGQGTLNGAVKFPAPVQDFNSVVVSFAEVSAAAQLQYPLPELAGGMGWHIILNADGTADVYWVKKYTKATNTIVKETFNQTITLSQSSALYLRNDLWIEGVLDSGKRLTIAAHHEGVGRDQSIYINGDLTYEDYNSWTVIGLAAESNVDIVQNPDTGDDSVLDIDGAILAQFGTVGRSFNIPMDFYGAIATKQGLLQTGNAVSTLTYDPNFMVTAPPYFPTGSSYVIDQWTELE